MNEPLSVLIVEDDPHVLLGCQQALELEDIQVLEQGDGLVYFSRSFHRLQRACRAA